MIFLGNVLLLPDNFQLTSRSSTTLPTLYNLIFLYGSEWISFNSTPLSLYNIIIHCIMSPGKNHIFLSLSSGRSSRASSKSATIEMYVGSNSYNETLSGETLGSLSDKSDTFFTSEHRHNLKVGVVVVKVFSRF